LPTDILAYRVQRDLKCSHSRVTTTFEFNLHSTEQPRSLIWPFTL